MNEETKSLVDRLRDMEHEANQAEFGATRLYNREDATTLREAIATLTRGETVAEMQSLNVPAREVIARKLCDLNTTEDDLDRAGTRRASMPRCLYIETNWRNWLEDADPILVALDFAPRVAAAFDEGIISTFEQRAKDLASVEKRSYARGVEDAAKVAERVYPKGSAHTYASENADRYMAQEETCQIVANRIRALLPKETAIEKENKSNA